MAVRAEISFLFTGLFSLYLFSLITLTIASADSETRKLTTVSLLPSNKSIVCPDDGPCYNLLYTKAVGTRDVLHYLYSSRGPPTVLIAKTKLDGAVHVNVEDYLSNNVTLQKNSIKITDTLSSVLLMFNHLMTFSDPKDTANINDAVSLHSYNLSEALWQNSSNISDLTQHTVEFRSTGNLMGIKNEANATGTFALRFQASSGETEFSSSLPHLHLMDNLTQIDLTLDSIQTNVSKLRFAVELVVLTSKNMSDNMSIEVYKSLDDENTPGSFRTINWLTNHGNPSSGAFAQWKQVCYTEEQKSLTSVTQSLYYPPLQNRSVSEKYDSLAYAVFGDDVRGLDSKALNISFGGTADKYYTNYMTWSLSFGYGAPPKESVSLLIILIIAIGLGIPVLLIIFGGLCLCIRSRRSRRDGYESLTSSYPQIG